MLTLDTARRCAADLSRSTTLLYPDDLDAKLAEASKLAGAEAALVLALVRPLLSLATSRVAGVTTWVPGVGVIIVLTGDNDQFTDRPIKNPGMTRAREGSL
jgi:hypothetical protein